MRKLITLMALVLGVTGFTGSVFALEMGDKEVAVTLTDTYVTRYIWRGLDLYSDNDGAHQPSLDITFLKLFYDTDLSLNVWGSFPLNSGHEDGEELDYTLSLSRDLGEYFSASIGQTYFDYPNTTSRSDVSESWGSLTLNKIPFLPIDVSATVFAGYDFQAKSGGPDEGWYYSWGFDTELPLPKCALFQDGQVLGLGVVNWGQDGVADMKPSSLYATETYISTSYALGDLSISPSLHYTINHEEAINNGDDEFWGAIEVSYAF